MSGGGSLHPGGLCPGWVCLGGLCQGDPPTAIRLRAGGTYPTGMHFFLIWRTQVLFVGPVIPMFWTSNDVSSGFQSQSGQPYLCQRRSIYYHI